MKTFRVVYVSMFIRGRDKFLSCRELGEHFDRFRCEFRHCRVAESHNFATPGNVRPWVGIIIIRWLNSHTRRSLRHRVNDLGDSSIIDISTFHSTYFVQRFSFLFVAESFRVIVGTVLIC